MPVLMSPFHSITAKVRAARHQYYTVIHSQVTSTTQWHSQGVCSTSPILHSDTQPRCVQHVTSTTQWYTAKVCAARHQYYAVTQPRCVQHVTSTTQWHNQGVCSTSPVLHSDTAHSGTIPPHCWSQTPPAQLSPEHSQHSFNGQPHRNNTQHTGSDINHHGYLLTVPVYSSSLIPHIFHKKRTTKHKNICTCKWSYCTVYCQNTNFGFLLF